MPNDAREAIACAIREAFNEGDLWYDEEGTHGDDVVAKRILALLADRAGVIEPQHRDDCECKACCMRFYQQNPVCTCGETKDLCPVHEGPALESGAR